MNDVLLLYGLGYFSARVDIIGDEGNLVSLHIIGLVIVLKEGHSERHTLTKRVVSHHHILWCDWLKPRLKWHLIDGVVNLYGYWSKPNEVDFFSMDRAHESRIEDLTA